MSGNRVAGGLITLIGAVMALIPMLLVISTIFTELTLGVLGNFIGFIIFIIILIGAIVAMAGKKGGAILCLILGLIVIVVNLLVFLLVMPDLANYIAVASSTWEDYIAVSLGFSFSATIYITFESILILLGGIIATPGE